MPENEQINVAPTPGAQPQSTQINLGGGLMPQPNGTWIATMWFSGLPDEATAQNFMRQLDGLVRKMFSAPPPQPNGGPPPV
jgi:hypothetical protein